MNSSYLIKLERHFSDQLIICYANKKMSMPIFSRVMELVNLLLSHPEFHMQRTLK